MTSRISREDHEVATISRKDYELAISRGREALAQPYAVSVRYVVNAHVLELVYSNGLALRFDPRDVPALKNVPRNALVHAYVTPGGDGLVFGEDEAAAVSIPGLVARLIPVDIARRTVAAARGSVRTASKADAARRNGAKGGRPVKPDMDLIRTRLKSVEAQAKR